MRFRNYCLVVIGDVKGIKNEIRKVAEGSPRYMDAKGMIITTFRSTATPSELKDYFKLNRRSFMIFDLNDEVSGAFINNVEIHKHLFNYIEKGGEEKLDKMSRKLLRDIEQTNSGTSVDSKIEVVKEIDVDELSEEEIQKAIRELLDKGDDMTDNDKKTLEELLKK